MFSFELRSYNKYLETNIICLIDTDMFCLVSSKTDRLFTVYIGVNLASVKQVLIQHCQRAVIVGSNCGLHFNADISA